MRLKFRYRPAYIERSPYGYPLADADSQRGDQKSSDASNNIWFKFGLGKYWSLDKYDGCLSFTILGIQKPDLGIRR